MTAMSNPHEWHVAQDREGFFIEDEFGEEIAPPWLPSTAGWRCQAHATAQSVLALVVTDALANYEPPSPPGFEGGFAANH